MSFYVEFEVRGLDDLMDSISEAAEKAKKRLEIAADQSAEMMREAAARYCPVKTGFLRSSIIWLAPERCLRRIWAMAHYAYFVERGTRFMAARAFMRRGFYENIEKVRDLVEEVAKGLFD